MAVDFERAAKRARAHFDLMSDEEREQWQDRNDEEHRTQHVYFRQGYRQGKCYLCGKDFKTISKDEPCLHWLLRQGRFKPKDIKLIAAKFGYHQIAAYLRWCANEERLLANINDLREEAPEGKFLSSTISWKNIQWSFDCSENDLTGHGGSHSNFPHYHFQMRIDGRQFINFNDYHLPFNDIDLFAFNLSKEQGMHMDFGAHGAGMQDALSFDPQSIIDCTQVSGSEEESAFNMSTMVIAQGEPMRGEDIAEAMEESRRTGRSMASILHKRFKDSSVSVQTVISPSESVPKITPRTERERR